MFILVLLCQHFGAADDVILLGLGELVEELDDTFIIAAVFYTVAPDGIDFTKSSSAIITIFFPFSFNSIAVLIFPP